MASARRGEAAGENTTFERENTTSPTDAKPSIHDVNEFQAVTNNSTSPTKAARRADSWAGEEALLLRASSEHAAALRRAALAVA
jgi:hypothetical protein